ncbi:MAG: GNAT family N-acetyltransferase [Gemmiger sp.]
MESTVLVRSVPPDCADARRLTGELNAVLTALTGASGAAGFAEADAAGPHSAFVIAYAGGKALGCGALRPLDGDTGELKRIYARPNRLGVGRAVLAALETEARALHYARLVLETRRVNRHAVEFYRKNGWTECPGYGVYAARPEAICFCKTME